MEHLNGISAEQYIYGVNAAWQLYKKLKYNFPDAFLMYVAESKWKYRLSYNKNDDRWYLLKVSFPNGVLELTQKNKTYESFNVSEKRRPNVSNRLFAPVNFIRNM